MFHLWPGRALGFHSHPWMVLVKAGTQNYVDCHSDVAVPKLDHSPASHHCPIPTHLQGCWMLMSMPGWGLSGDAVTAGKQWWLY